MAGGVKRVLERGRRDCWTKRGLKHKGVRSICSVEQLNTLGKYGRNERNGEQKKDDGAKGMQL